MRGMAKTPVRRTSNTVEENEAADRAARRHVGQQAIRRAQRAFSNVEAGYDRAREHLYGTMRSYSDVFREEELVRMSGVSRPTVRKRVLGKDLELPEPGGAGTLVLDDNDSGGEKTDETS